MNTLAYDEVVFFFKNKTLFTLHFFLNLATEFRDRTTSFTTKPFKIREQMTKLKKKS